MIYLALNPQTMDTLDSEKFAFGIFMNSLFILGGFYFLYNLKFFHNTGGADNYAQDKYIKMVFVLVAAATWFFYLYEWFVLLVNIKSAPNLTVIRVLSSIPVIFVVLSFIAFLFFAREYDDSNDKH